MESLEASCSVGMDRALKPSEGVILVQFDREGPGSHAVHELGSTRLASNVPCPWVRGPFWALERVGGRPPGVPEDTPVGALPLAPVICILFAVFTQVEFPLANVGSVEFSHVSIHLFEDHESTFG